MTKTDQQKKLTIGGWLAKIYSSKRLVQNNKKTPKSSKTVAKSSIRLA